MSKTREHFARITTYANIDKFETGKSGRKITVTGFTLSAEQLEAIDKLADGEKEVLLSVVPSQRGTLFTGKDVVDLDARITSNSSTLEQDAIGMMILATGRKMRERMLEKFCEGVQDWDNESCLEAFKERAAAKVAEGDWIDAMNYIAMAMNLEKPIAGQDEEEIETEEQPTQQLVHYLEGLQEYRENISPFAR